MYSVKIMSGQNLPDSDVGKGFRIILVGEGQEFEFGNRPDTGEPFLVVRGKGDFTDVEYPLTGNAYVMNESGKTIASFWGRTINPIDSNDMVPETEAYVSESLPTLGSPREPLRTIDSIREQYNDRNLTEMQLRYLAEPRLKVCNNEVSRGNSYRARVAYLILKGIPNDIAMENSWYLTEKQRKFEVVVDSNDPDPIRTVEAIQSIVNEARPQPNKGSRTLPVEHVVSA
ncbi:hypothetical protein ST201phi2-1p034 [Pseudomonas phage 201phi2-1]|uniref:Uncharacterized protein n=1 Tax=Pseudomonas phage 201phi2-1 TaxID=198110 RepID=B3FK09_BP201|nr:hypothetical protein ST201phi2-1p034 [Pseudomonas phage 201phi2-1]ABY62867.1 hypothetical protein 201phi2-1p034 [Pseudomonas phage 201phi2-1]